MKLKSVSIVGFGRFGQTFAKLLNADFKLTIFNRSKIKKSSIKLLKTAKITEKISEVYLNNAVFYCVPISEFEKVIELHSKYFRNNLLIDTLSVKEYPEKIFKKVRLRRSFTAILTHPMFGPDSAKESFDNLPMIVSNFNASNETYRKWINYFKNKKLKVIEMTARNHDKLAAHSQGLTHFIGRLLQIYKFKPSSIDSVGAKKMLELMDQVCNDSWKLYGDLQKYNPYSKDMAKRLDVAFEKLHKKTFKDLKQVKSVKHFML
ncbi:prephenate dehydrogenase/arogenate dehydrogenase family protein [Candidatus Roizmanbacteria bacterium]|nr:prephenate dehydrogenase/arogenate dehydrogenase family protein [Candidatus Roizmanbacteria bacterium]